jgi:hypothetical protein
MKNYQRIAATLVALAVLALSAGCASTMSDAKFGKLSDAEQEAYIAEQEALAEMLARKKEAEFKAFKTVKSGTGSTKMKAVRAPTGTTAALVVENESGIIPGLGIESVSIAQAPVTESGAVVPKAMTHTGGHQEGLIRDLGKEVVRSAGLFYQGSNAAQINADVCEGGGCGGGSPTAIAISDSAALNEQSMNSGVTVQAEY